MESAQTDPETEIEEAKVELLYSIDRVPPWHICIILGLQHFLMHISSSLSTSLPLAPHLCIEVGKEANEVVKAELLATAVFSSGIVTLLQSTFGSRLPIIQGGSSSFLAPTFAILANFGDCPTVLPVGTNLTEYQINHPNNTETVVINGSEEHDEVWKVRMRALQGAIMMASLLEVVLGFSGLMGLLIRYIGPLVIAPTIALIGLSLFPIASQKSAHQWGIALLCVALMTIFSQYLGRVKIPVYSKERGTCSTKNGYPVFKLFPVLFTILVAYIVSTILTYTDVFPDDRDHTFYRARTDARISVLTNAKWFRVPYPGQWGLPTVAISGVFGMMAGILASMVESVGDYYAAAKLSGAPPPTQAAINRGIGMEGIGCVMSGAWGSGNGLTSFSANIAALGITQVGSRRVIQVAAVIMILLSVLGKFCAVFVTIPDPILGGVYMVMFGMIAAVGLANLQAVDLSSTRNLFIIGTSLLMGLAVPEWTHNNKDQIQTGSDVVDEIFVVLLSTSMFVGGTLAFFLDNTIPGTLEERGMLVWSKSNTDRSLSPEQLREINKTYDMPFGNDRIYRAKWTSYMPFCPNFLLHRYKQNASLSDSAELKTEDTTAESNSETAM